MANISDETREEWRINELKRGIVMALHDQGQSCQRIARLVGDSYNYVSRVVSRGVELGKRFEPWIVEQIIESAQRMTSFETYRSELESLAQQTKTEAHNGPIINQKAITIFCQRMYAERMEDLWIRIKNNKPAHIFKYQNIVIAPKVTLEGKLIVVPKDVLPASVRDTHVAKRPYLALAYEKGKVELCDENADMLSIRVVGIGNLHPRARKNATDRVDPMRSLPHEQVRIICVDYFKRNGYDLIANLHEQIEGRALDQIAPVVLQQRLQLVGRLYRTKSAD